MRVGEVFEGKLFETGILIILLWYLDSHAFLHSVLIDYLRNVPFAREKLVATLARPFEAPSSAQVKTQKQKKVTQQSIPFLVAIPPIASCNQPVQKLHAD